MSHGTHRTYESYGSHGWTLHLRLPPRRVLARPELHRGAVIQNRAVFGVTLQGSPGPVGDVAQMAQERALVPLLDLAVDLLIPPVGRQPVAEVSVLPRLGRRELLDLLALHVVDRVPAVLEYQAPLLAVEDHVEGRPARAGVAAQSLPGDHFAAVELEADGVRVRSLLVVFVPVAAARRGHVHRVIDPEAPPADVDRVDPVVAQLAVAPVPEPVPVVVEVVVLERPVRGRALPQLVVEALRRVGLFAPADRRAVVEVPRLGQVRPAEDAVAQLLSRLDVVAVAAALVAHLDVALVLAGGGDEQLPLARVVAAGLLDVHVLAGLAGEDGHDRVPVVARGDGDPVNFLVVQDAAEIADRLGVGGHSLDLADRGGRLLGPRFVHVADVGDGDIGDAGERPGVLGPAAAGPGDAEPDAGGLHRPGRIREVRGRGGGSEERATGEGSGHGRSSGVWRGLIRRARRSVGIVSCAWPGPRGRCRPAAEGTWTRPHRVRRSGVGRSYSRGRTPPWPSKKPSRVPGRGPDSSATS